jgi:hypothetical protein
LSGPTDWGDFSTGYALWKIAWWSQVWIAIAFSSFVFASASRNTSFTIDSSGLVSTVRSVVTLMPSLGPGPAATRERKRNARVVRMRIGLLSGVVDHARVQR